MNDELNLWCAIKGRWRGLGHGGGRGGGGEGAGGREGGGGGGERGERGRVGGARGSGHSILSCCKIIPSTAIGRQ